MSQFDAASDAARRAAIDDIVRIQLGLMRGTGEGKRGQHYKQQALLKARFEILAGIPERFKVGLFSQRATFDAYVRFSNGRQADDRHPDVHGCAIKLVGVPGAKILEAESGAGTHDFILADHPVFIIRDTLEYARFMREFDGGQPPFGVPLKFLAWLLFNHPRDLAVLSSFDKQTHDNLLGATFYSQTPYGFGMRGAICRYRLTPAPGNVGAIIPVAERDGAYLRTAMAQRLSDGAAAAVFDFSVQTIDEPTSDVMDNPTVAWDAPTQAVARLTIPPQKFDTPERDEFGENLSYTPWHALPEHRPVGQINEIRKAVYLASSSLRHTVNGKPREEPRGGEI